MFIMWRSRAAFLIFFLALQNVYGALLGQMEFPEGSRIGFFVSTFDPLTPDHERLIADALASGEIDYLVVIPTDFTPHKLARESMHHRQEMLKTVYRDDPRVVVTESNYGYAFPQSRNAVKWVRAQNPSASTVGVVLLEDMREAPLKRRMARWLTPVGKWLVLSPPEPDLWGFPERAFGNRQISFATSISPRSSSAARRFLLGNEAFFKGRSAKPEELALSLPVQRYIRRNRLYFAKPSRCEMLSDFVRSF